MFFKFNRKRKYLAIEDGYAHLDYVSPSENLDFTFTYGIKQRDVVQSNAMTVSVTIISRVIKRKNVLENSHRGYIDTKAVVKNVLTQIQDAKNAIKQQQQFTVASRESDIGAFINNEILGQLRSGAEKITIPSLRKTILSVVPTVEIREANEVKPVLQFVAHSSITSVQRELSGSLDANPRALMHDMVVRQGLDPSHVTTLTHRSLPATDVFRGILRPSKRPENSYDPMVRLLHYHIFGRTTQPFRTTTQQFLDDELVKTAKSVLTDDLVIPVRISLPKYTRFIDQTGDLRSNFIVVFTLRDGRTRAVVDQVSKPLDISEHMRLYFTPRKPPIVQAHNSDSQSRTNLNIRQVDPGATGVKVYKKVINRASVVIDDYRLIGTFSLTARDQSLSVNVETVIYSPSVYRVIPVGLMGTLGYEYTNVVIKPSHYRPIKALSLVASTVDTGVEVEIRKLPIDAVAIEVLARNLTIHEKQWTNVGGITLVDDVTRKEDYFSVIHERVSDRNVYEYVSRITFKSGLTELSGSAILEHISLTPGVVDIKVTDLQVSHDDDTPNVTFTVSSELIDNDIDAIRKLLERQDIKEFFLQDLNREREFMKGLIAHNVQRVNLSTGEREDFGVLTSGAFDDKSLRKNNAVKELELGYKYRYEVRTLIRAPETLFEAFIKDKVDPVTKKSYKFKPSKFLHPVTLREGTIVTVSGLKTRSPKDSLSQGAIGSMERVDVSFDGDPARIVDQSAANFDRRLNVVTWKVEGNLSQVDHFLVMKDVHGVRTTVGKVHSEFEFGNAQFIHDTTERDDGELKYVIVPIFNDYNVGEEATTNSVIV
jgi:hypothetical protein